MYSVRILIKVYETNLFGNTNYLLQNFGVNKMQLYYYYSSL